jgi:hypothetical protein
MFYIVIKQLCHFVVQRALFSPRPEESVPRTSPVNLLEPTKIMKRYGFWNRVGEPNENHMKRQMLIRNRVLVLAIGMATVFTAHSQVQQKRSETILTPRVGVKGGVNFSNLFVNDVQDENLKAGLNLGLFAKFPVTRGLSVQPELLYSSKGSTITYNNLLGTGKYRFNLNYIELPVLAVINVARNFNLHVGPYVSYLASANIKKKVDNGENPEIASFKEEDFNRIDYGLAGGIGFDVQNFTLGARYTYGLNEVGKSDNLTSRALKDSKNGVISFYVGYGF